MANNHWPYLLRILLKAGWSVEGLAQAAMTSEERVRLYLSAKAVPEQRTAIVFRQILNRHKRHDGLRIRHASDVIPIVPTNEIPSGAPDPLARGVFEERSAPAGYRQFRAIAEDGTELISLRFHWRAEERDVVPGLRAWLDRADPIIRLVPDASSQSSS